MKLPSASPQAVSAFEKLLPHGPGITSRKMFGQPAAFVNGSMFFGVFGDRLLLRLPEADREEFLQLPDSGIFEPMAGRKMREYVTFPHSLESNRAAAGRWIQRSLTWAATLPPKGSGKAKGPARTSHAKR